MSINLGLYLAFVKRQAAKINVSVFNSTFTLYAHGLLFILYSFHIVMIITNTSQINKEESTGLKREREKRQTKQNDLQK